MIRRLLKNFLERLGYKVILATNGEDAWDLFFSYPLQIHLVISDAVMPKLGGPGLYQRVHHLNPQMPFVLVSGYSEEINRKSFAHTLEIPMFPKPIDFKALGVRLRELLDQRAKAPRSGLEIELFQT